jgi:hypothetical protein
MKRSRRGLTTNSPVTVSAPARWIVRATLSAGVLALAVSPFGALAVANADYKESDFASCLEREMPTDYCCEHAGGVMRQGACINPDDLLIPSGGAVLEVQPEPPTNVPPRVVTDLSSGSVLEVQPAPPTKVPPRVIADAPVLIATR